MNDPKDRRLLLRSTSFLCIALLIGICLCLLCALVPVVIGWTTGKTGFVYAGLFFVLLALFFGRFYVHIPRRVFATAKGIELTYPRKTVLIPWNHVTWSHSLIRANTAPSESGSWWVSLKFSGKHGDIAFPVTTEEKAKSVCARLAEYKERASAEHPRTDPEQK